MKRAVVLLTVGGLAWGLGPIAVQADWDPGEPHKMHYPQLPDPNGWDVDVTTDFIFDDWMCSGSGPVSDIHFWASSQGDMGGPLLRIDVEIWSDVPVGDPNNQFPFSHPGGVLWQKSFFPADWTVRGPEFGQQGWLAPNPGDVFPNDHMEYWQFNFENFDDPFIQQAGDVYWLGIHMIPLSANDAPWGWKTTQDHWNDDAVWYLAPPGWRELRDPFTTESLDMAFVITPEPSGLVLLLVGSTLLLKRSAASPHSGPYFDALPLVSIPIRKV
jgi:hypothetical protein